MTDAKFAELVTAWIEDQPNVVMKGIHGARAVFYNKLPRSFRPAGFAHWSIKTGLASSAPGLAYYYGTLNGKIATAAFLGLFTAHSVVSWLDKATREKPVNETDTLSDALVRFGDLLASLKSRAVADRNKDDAIRACLGILETFARKLTGARKGEIAVSLAQYAGSSPTRLKIRHRNPGNERPTNREFDGAFVLGHHACMSGVLPRVVNDVRRFGKKASQSPTQSKVNYRSFFIFPLENGVKIRGFVSVDCGRPYAFYGSRAKEMIIVIEPVLELIRQLLREE